MSVRTQAFQPVGNQFANGTHVGIFHGFYACQTSKFIAVETAIPQIKRAFAQLAVKRMSNFNKMSCALGKCRFVEIGIGDSSEQRAGNQFVYVRRHLNVCAAQRCCNARKLARGIQQHVLDVGNFGRFSAHASNRTPDAFCSFLTLIAKH